jgi:hypothetical protein
MKDPHTWDAWQKYHDKLHTWGAWREVHQPFELEWWREHLDQLTDPGFTDKWKEIKQFIKPRGRILDIGCGPRPPFAPSCTVIEPLAHEYRHLLPHAYWNGVSIYNKPAEHHLPDLNGKFDTIVCWNALDHAVGWRAILLNIRCYAAPAARIAIATDFFPPFMGHPGYESTEADARREFLEEIDKHFIITEKREPLDRAMAVVLLMKRA